MNKEIPKIPLESLIKKIGSSQKLKEQESAIRETKDPIEALIDELSIDEEKRNMTQRILSERSAEPIEALIKKSVLVKREEIPQKILSRESLKEIEGGTYGVSNKILDKVVTEPEEQASGRVDDFGTEFSKLRTEEESLSKLEKEMLDLNAMDPQQLSIKGLFSDRQRRKMLENMANKAQKNFEKKRKEVENLRERTILIKKIGQKEKILNQYEKKLEKAEMSYRTSEIEYYRKLVKDAEKEIKRLKNKSEAGFWRKLFGNG
jgi:hypothetical protein